MAHVPNPIRESVISVVPKGIFFICLHYPSYSSSNCSTSFLFFTPVVAPMLRTEIAAVALAKRAHSRRFLPSNSAAIKPGSKVIARTNGVDGGYSLRPPAPSSSCHHA